MCSDTTIDGIYKIGILEIIDTTKQMQCFIATISDSICN